MGKNIQTLKKLDRKKKLAEPEKKK